LFVYFYIKESQTPYIKNGVCNAVGNQIQLMSGKYTTCLEIICNFPTIYKTGDKGPSDILKQSGYFDISQDLTEEKIATYINNNCGLVETWLNFTENIRHNPAWGLQTLDKSTWTVFYMDNGQVKKEFTFDNSANACAKLIKMTMDEITKSV
jgi:hypothetical protein